MINEAYQITFGVEIETLLAFHESFLREHLQSTQNASGIIKIIPNNVRRQLKQTHQDYWTDRGIYLGWGLTSTPRNEGAWLTVQTLQDQINNFGVRGYADEILTLAETLLPNVRLHKMTREKYDEFSVWHLTHDNSLVGVSKDDLARELAKNNQIVDDVNNWDAHGIELVSRVLPFELQSFLEVQTRLSGLCGISTDRHTAFATDCCGLHIHVGLPPPQNHAPGTPLPTFSLPMVQHLAYVLVMYEEQIMTLFPKERRARSGDLVSNLEDFFAAEEEPEDMISLPSLPGEEEEKAPGARNDTEIGQSDLTTNLAGLDISSEVLEESTQTASEAGRPESAAPATPLQLLPTNVGPVCSTIPFSEAREKIFAENMTIEKLVKLMCTTRRQHIVNLQNLLRAADSPLPHTIEFRQHEGTTDAQEIRHWTTFIIALVRLCEENARMFGVGRSKGGVWEGYRGHGYRWREWDPELNVEDLVEMARVGDGEWDWGGKQWVKERVRKWT